MLAFGFLGSRPIWDSDEGRYTNVALNTLESGETVHPRRNDEEGHWTKPPVTYWAVAASVALAYVVCSAEGFGYFGEAGDASYRLSAAGSTTSRVARVFVRSSESP